MSTLELFRLKEDGECVLVVLDEDYFKAGGIYQYESQVRIVTVAGDNVPDVGKPIDGRPCFYLDRAPSEQYVAAAQKLLTPELFAQLILLVRRMAKDSPGLTVPIQVVQSDHILHQMAAWVDYADHAVA